MNLKDMIVPFLLAVVTTWALHYFFFGKKETEPQYQFSAPQSAVECKPLQKEVTFASAIKLGTPTITPIETSWGYLEFTTEGATLNRLEFKRIVNGVAHNIGTIFPLEQQERAHRAFLVTLSEETPYVYHLRHTGADDATVTVVYEATSSDAIISKAFTIYKNIHQIDVKISVQPQHSQLLNARIFYPAPILPELKEQEQIAADVLYGADTFKKMSRDTIPADTYWVKPFLFGVENKYFSHVMVADPDAFVQRAYYKLVGKEGLVAILEGPQIDKPTSWTIRFYVGPKEAAAMEQVDKRLEKLLDYSGIWAPISRLLLLILNWLNNYLHNYGFAIIVLTFLIKLLLLPFAWRADKGMKDRAEMQ